MTADGAAFLDADDGHLARSRLTADSAVFLDGAGGGRLRSRFAARGLVWGARLGNKVPFERLIGRESDVPAAGEGLGRIRRGPRIEIREILASLAEQKDFVRDEISSQRPAVRMKD